MESSIELDKPFPLKRTFHRTVLPGLVLFIFTLTALGLVGIDLMVKKVYLDLAHVRAEALARDISEHNSDAFAAYFATTDPLAFLAKPVGGDLLERMNKVSKDSRVTHFRLYNKLRQVLYSEIPTMLGTREENPELDKVFRKHQSALISKPNVNYYELYVPLLDDKGELTVVFELYENKVFLDKLLANSLIPSLILPSILFLLLMAWLWRLVFRAQREIDRRSSALTEMRHRLERFLSTSAVNAALDATSADHEIPPRRLVTTLLYSDVREFTSLAENSSPRKTIDFLNNIMGMQVQEVRRFEGDVDKMIGDAVLARFDGADAETRALGAAMCIQKIIDKSDYPRQVGIGVYSGNVISCTIGTEHRHDYTIIGDAVNVSARLCSEAKGGEIVVNVSTIRQSEFSLDEFSDVETISVKGREQELNIHRWIATDHIDKSPPEPAF